MENGANRILSHTSLHPFSLDIIGICAMDDKARSKPMRNILDRLLTNGPFETSIFGDKCILDEGNPSYFSQRASDLK